MVHGPDSERGAALLTVLLLVAVLAVLAAHGLDRLAAATKLASNSQQIAQARAYLAGAEGLALQTAEEVVQASPGRTTNVGGWNGREVAYPLPGGQIRATIQDGGNCFNLNSVVQEAQGRLVAQPLGAEQFRKLLVMLEVPSGDAQDIAMSLTDWIDSDQTPGPNGAEDSYYRAQDDPYRTPDNLIADRSELRLIKGVTPPIYNRVSPWVCALPDAQLSPININTLRAEQAILLAMLGSQPPDVRRLQGFLAQKPLTGFASAPQFWAQPPVAALQASQPEQNQVKLTTRWFRLDLDLAVGSALVEEQALIDAARQPARLVHRSWAID